MSSVFGGVAGKTGSCCQLPWQIVSCSDLALAMAPKDMPSTAQEITEDSPCSRWLMQIVGGETFGFQSCQGQYHRSLQSFSKRLLAEWQRRGRLRKRCQSMGLKQQKKLNLGKKIRIILYPLPTFGAKFD